MRALQRALCFGVLLLVPSLSAKAQQEAIGTQADDRPRIGGIEVVVNDVFDRDKGKLFRLANKLHVRTREKIVRRELLFRSGDYLDREALEQTERNLRALPFLRDARVETVAVPMDEGDAAIEGVGIVDVRVTTWDSWSTSPVIGFANVGDRVTWTLGASEKNLLGSGRQVEIARRSGLERDDTQVFFGDPRVGGSRFVLESSYADQSDGSRATLSLKRPFFSLGTSWAFGMWLEAFDRLDPVYLAGERVQRLRHVRRRQEIQMARAIHRGRTSASRLHLSFRQREDEVAGILRDFGIFEVGISSVQHRFVKLTHINQFERTEDFNLGREFSAFVGVSTGWLGGEPETAWFLSAEHKQGFRIGERQFLIGRLRWQGRHRQARWEDNLARADLEYLNKLSPRRLLLLSARLARASRLDPETQLTLGAHNGLRGYRVYQWTGTRSLLLSVEKRWFLADDVGQLVSIGFSAFADSGYVWTEQESVDFGDMKTNVGIGLLLGRNRLSSTRPGVRFDLAYALDRLQGHSRWLFSAGSQIAL